MLLSLHNNNYSCRLGKAVQTAQHLSSITSTLDDEWSRWLLKLRGSISSSRRDPYILSGQAFSTLARTLHGFGDLPEAKKSAIKKESASFLESRLCILDTLQTTNDATAKAHRIAFDAWHEETCLLLYTQWSAVFPLTQGQAQKWLNVLIKYHAAFGETGMHPNVRKNWLSELHSPIDKEVFGLIENSETIRDKFPTEFWSWYWRSCPAWSRITDYKYQYVPLQNLFRHLAKQHGDFAPCAIELVGWSESVVI